MDDDAEAPAPRPRPGPGHGAGTPLNGPPPVEAAAAVYSDDVVAALPSWRRWVILFSVCIMALPVTFVSTAITTVNPEIAATFGTEPTAISSANAGVLVAMSLSALIWLPITTLVGRRSAYISATVIFTLCSLGCALSDGVATLTAMWVLSGTTVPFFLVAGQTILSDIFEPTVRGTAVGFFLGSTVSAQSLTPMTSSIIATFTTWRVIFGVQGAISLVGMILAFFFVPRSAELSNVRQDEKPEKLSARAILAAFNPAHVFRLFKFPSITLADLTCGFLSLTQFGLLSSIRHVINPLFGLSTPLYSGLFFLAPGVGFLAGSIVGGGLSDRTVKRYMARRGGVRLAEDRLNGSLPWILVVLPVGTLLYGWSADRHIGGMGLPISAAFIAGFGLMAAFNGLNTYAAEVHPQFKAGALSGKYTVQYLFSATGVGASVPLIDKIGAGWTFTFYTGGVLIGGCLVLIVTRFLVRETTSNPYPRWFDRKNEESSPAS